MISQIQSSAYDGAFEQQNEQCYFEKQPRDVKLIVLQKLNSRDLLQFSYTSKSNHWTVLNSSKLLDELLSGQIIDLGIRIIPKLLFPTDDTLHWHFSIALGIRDPDQGMEWRKKYLSTHAQVSSCHNIAEKIDRSEAIRILVRGAQELKNTDPENPEDEFLIRMVQQLAPLDAQKALEINEMIAHEKLRAITKTTVIEYLPEMQKRAYLNNVALHLDFSSLTIYACQNILEATAPVASFPIRKLLIQKALVVFESEDASNLYHIQREAFPLFKHDPQWVLSIIEDLELTPYHIQGHCELAAIRFPEEPEKAKEHVQKAIQLSSQTYDKPLAYERIAHTLKIWDKAEAEKYYRLGIEHKLKFKDYRCWLFDKMIKKLSKINFAAALQYVEAVDDKETKGINLCRISLLNNNKVLYKKGIDIILDTKEGYRRYVLMCSPYVNAFGEELAISSAYRLNDNLYRAQELFRIARRIIYRDPQTARKLVKDAISISNKMDTPKKRMINLLQFINPFIW